MSFHIDLNQRYVGQIEGVYTPYLHALTSLSYRAAAKVIGLAVVGHWDCADSVHCSDSNVERKDILDAVEGEIGAKHCEESNDWLKCNDRLGCLGKPQRVSPDVGPDIEHGALRILRQPLYLSP